MANNPFRLDGQLALVTGGGSGLGLAISQTLIQAGAAVIITGRREEKLKPAVQQLGRQAHYIRHDVTDLNSIPGLVRHIEQQWQPVDILVNNAGIHHKKSVFETTDADMQQMLQTHLAGAFALSRTCAQLMVERRRGPIIGHPADSGLHSRQKRNDGPDQGAHRRACAAQCAGQCGCSRLD